MNQLRAIAFHFENENQHRYPYNLPVFKGLQEIQFKQPVTIFVGENGSGKSTILESIATSANSITIGGNHVISDLAKELKRKVKLTWSIKTRKGFYFKGNDFIQFIDGVKDMKEESRAMIEEIELGDLDPLAKVPHARTLHELENLYGEGLEFRSHGESFLDLFKARFQPGGLYILDEPEAPLSPINQLALISMMKGMVKEGAQFILATHSPILLAFPEAEILSIEGSELKSVSYAELEHVALTRDFLNHPESFLRHL